MVNGWHRFHSAMDNTKHIGFTRNGRAIRFANRANRPYEQCYNFVKIDPLNIDFAEDDQTAIIDLPSTVKSSKHRSVSHQYQTSTKSAIPKRHANFNNNNNNSNNKNINRANFNTNHNLKNKNNFDNTTMIHTHRHRHQHQQHHHQNQHSQHTNHSYRHSSHNSTSLNSNITNIDQRKKNSTNNHKKQNILRKQPMANNRQINSNHQQTLQRSLKRTSSGLSSPPRTTTSTTTIPPTNIYQYSDDNHFLDFPKVHKSYRSDDYSNDEYNKWLDYTTVTKKIGTLNTKKVTIQNSGVATKLRHSKHLRRKNHLITNQSDLLFPN